MEEGEMDFHGMKRIQLQALCKKHGIPANKSNAEMAKLLTLTLKENENSINQGQCVEPNESACVDLPKNFKKVRFSPDIETREYEPSAYKGRTRRTVVNSVKVYGSRPRTGNGRVQKIVERNVDRVVLPVDGKKRVRGGEKKGTAEVENVEHKDKSQPSLSTEDRDCQLVKGGTKLRRRQLRNREVVIKENVEGVEGDSVVSRRNSKRRACRKRETIEGSDNIPLLEEVPQVRVSATDDLKPTNAPRRSRKNSRKDEGLSLLSGELGISEIVGRTSRSHPELVGDTSSVTTANKTETVKVQDEPEKAIQIEESLKAVGRYALRRKTILHQKEVGTEIPSEGVESGRGARKPKRDVVKGTDSEPIMEVVVGRRTRFGAQAAEKASKVENEDGAIEVSREQCSTVRLEEVSKAQSKNATRQKTVAAHKGKGTSEGSKVKRKRSRISDLKAVNEAEAYETVKVQAEPVRAIQIKESLKGVDRYALRRKTILPQKEVVIEIPSQGVESGRGARKPKRDVVEGTDSEPVMEAVVGRRTGFGAQVAEKASIVENEAGVIEVSREQCSTVRLEEVPKAQGGNVTRKKSVAPQKDKVTSEGSKVKGKRLKISDLMAVNEAEASVESKGKFWKAPVPIGHLRKSRHNTAVSSSTLVADEAVGKVGQLKQNHNSILEKDGSAVASECLVGKPSKQSTHGLNSDPVGSTMPEKAVEEKVLSMSELPVMLEEATFIEETQIEHTALRMPEATGDTEDFSLNYCQEVLQTLGKKKGSESKSSEMRRASIVEVSSVCFGMQEAADTKTDMLETLSPTYKWPNSVCASANQEMPENSGQPAVVDVEASIDVGDKENFAADVPEVGLDDPSCRSTECGADLGNENSGEFGLAEIQNDAGLEKEFERKELEDDKQLECGAVKGRSTEVDRITAPKDGVRDLENAGQNITTNKNGHEKGPRDFRASPAACVEMVTETTKSNLQVDGDDLLGQQNVISENSRSASDTSRGTCVNELLEGEGTCLFGVQEDNDGGGNFSAPIAPLQLYGSDGKRLSFSTSDSSIDRNTQQRAFNFTMLEKGLERKELEEYMHCDVGDDKEWPTEVDRIPVLEDGVCSLEKIGQNNTTNKIEHEEALCKDIASPATGKVMVSLSKKSNSQDGNSGNISQLSRGTSMHEFQDGEEAYLNASGQDTEGGENCSAATVPFHCEVSSIRNQRLSPFAVGYSMGKNIRHHDEEMTIKSNASCEDEKHVLAEKEDAADASPHSSLQDLQYKEEESYAIAADDCTVKITGQPEFSVHNASDKTLKSEATEANSPQLLSKKLSGHKEMNIERNCSIDDIIDLLISKQCNAVMDMDSGKKMGGESDVKQCEIEEEESGCSVETEHGEDSGCQANANVEFSFTQVISEGREGSQSENVDIIGCSSDLHIASKNVTSGKFMAGEQCDYAVRKETAKGALSFELCDHSSGNVAAIQTGSYDACLTPTICSGVKICRGRDFVSRKNTSKNMKRITLSDRKNTSEGSDSNVPTSAQIMNDPLDEEKVRGDESNGDLHDHISRDSEAFKTESAPVTTERVEMQRIQNEGTSDPNVPVGLSNLFSDYDGFFETDAIDSNAFPHVAFVDCENICEESNEVTGAESEPGVEIGKFEILAKVNASELEGSAAIVSECHVGTNVVAAVVEDVEKTEHDMKLKHGNLDDEKDNFVFPSQQITPQGIIDPAVEGRHESNNYCNVVSHDVRWQHEIQEDDATSVDIGKKICFEKIEDSNKWMEKKLLSPLILGSSRKEAKLNSSEQNSFAELYSGMCKKGSSNGAVSDLNVLFSHGARENYGSHPGSKSIRDEGREKAMASNERDYENICETSNEVTGAESELGVEIGEFEILAKVNAPELEESAAIVSECHVCTNVVAAVVADVEKTEHDVKLKHGNINVEKDDFIFPSQQVTPKGIIDPAVEGAHESNNYCNVVSHDVRRQHEIEADGAASVVIGKKICFEKIEDSNKRMEKKLLSPLILGSSRKEAKLNSSEQNSFAESYSGICKKGLSNGAVSDLNVLFSDGTENITRELPTKSDASALFPTWEGSSIQGNGQDQVEGSEGEATKDYLISNDSQHTVSLDKTVEEVFFTSWEVNLIRGNGEEDPVEKSDREVLKENFMCVSDEYTIENAPKDIKVDIFSYSDIQDSSEEGLGAANEVVAAETDKMDVPEEVDIGGTLPLVTPAEVSLEIAASAPQETFLSRSKLEENMSVGQIVLADTSCGIPEIASEKNPTQREGYEVLASPDIRLQKTREAINDATDNSSLEANLSDPQEVAIEQENEHLDVVHEPHPQSSQTEREQHTVGTEAAHFLHDLDDVFSEEIVVSGNGKVASPCKIRTDVDSPAGSAIRASQYHKTENGAWKLNLFFEENKHFEIETLDSWFWETKSRNVDAWKVEENVIATEQATNRVAEEHQGELGQGNDEQIRDTRHTSFAVSYDEPPHSVDSSQESYKCENHEKNLVNAKDSYVCSQKEILIEAAEVNACQDAVSSEERMESDPGNLKQDNSESVGVGDFAVKEMDVSGGDEQMGQLKLPSPERTFSCWKEEGHGFSVKETNTCVTGRQSSRTGHQGTPQKMVSFTDMKENLPLPSIKREQLGEMTAWNTMSKRRALENIRNN